MFYEFGGTELMKILVLTSVYPQPDDDKYTGVTPVVHYYAKEWAKAGHDVLVIHNANKFILPVYLLPKSLKRKINSIMGIGLPEYSQRKKLFRIADGVNIVRLPILKMVPRRDFLTFQIKRQFNTIEQVLEHYDFHPDVILGHWESPQIPLLSLLKEKYKCQTSLVFHGADYISRDSYVQKNKRHLRNIDIFGARSEAISGKVQMILSLPYQPFICYSGIPEEFMNDGIDDKVAKLNDDKLVDFLYVGRLIKRKNIESIIKALKQVYGEDKFTLNIIGTGDCESELKELANQFQIEDRVIFHGLQPRAEVIDYMRKAQCFTMISSNEVFGLVYLEAMAQGCIVIASKGGGFDGIIVDGENGFLCEQGNHEELAQIYRRINTLSKAEKRIIAQNAIKTASTYTDSNVARRYLDSVIQQ